MKLNHTYRLFFFVIIIGLMLTISACGKDESSDKKSNKGEEKDLILDSEMGDVSIPSNPKKIIASFHEDSLLAFSVTPVAKWSIGESVQDYLESDLKDVPTIEWNLPLEQMLAYEPDLIILENNMDGYEGTYEDYNKIAPTYVMTKETTEDWRKQIDIFGKILDKEDQSKDILSEYEEEVANASDEIKDAIGDESVAAIWVTGDKFFLFEENRHSAEVLYSELGIEVPNLVKELGETKEEWNPISIEKLSELDADHVFLLADKNEQGLKTLDNSAVWQSTPAVKNNHVYHLEDGSNWTNKGLNASKQTIDDLIEALVN